MGTRDSRPQNELVDRLQAAVNAHDLDRLVDCFSDDYVNETPAHPARGFRGREQVRRNWSQIFAGVPDIVCDLICSDQVGQTLWTEWEMRGHRLDGSDHLMRGVVRFTVEGGRARAARFFLEPVDPSDVDADQAAERLIRPQS